MTLLKSISHGIAWTPAFTLKLKTMKTLTLILLLVSGVAFGQDIKLDTGMTFSTNWTSVKYYALTVQDSTETIFQIGADSLGNLDYNDIFVSDSLKAIIKLAEWVKSSSDQWHLESRKLEAAEDILRNITEEGFVTNWKKWHKAVKRYKEVYKED